MHMQSVSFLAIKTWESIQGTALLVALFLILPGLSPQTLEGIATVALDHSLPPSMQELPIFMEARLY